MMIAVALAPQHPDRSVELFRAYGEIDVSGVATQRVGIVEFCGRQTLEDPTLDALGSEKGEHLGGRRSDAKQRCGDCELAISQLRSQGRADGLHRDEGPEPVVGQIAPSPWRPQIDRAGVLPPRLHLAANLFHQGDHRGIGHPLIDERPQVDSGGAWRERPHHSERRSAGDDHVSAERGATGTTHTSRTIPPDVASGRHPFDGSNRAAGSREARVGVDGSSFGAAPCNEISAPTPVSATIAAAATIDHRGGA